MWKWCEKKKIPKKSRSSDPVIELSDVFSSSPVEALQAVNEEVPLLDAETCYAIFFFFFLSCVAVHFLRSVRLTFPGFHLQE